MVSVVVLASLLCPATPPVDPAVQERAAKLVRQLGDENFARREEAQAELTKLGVAAEEALRQGILSKDPEVRDVCRVLLDKVLVISRNNRMQAFLADKEDRLDPPLAGWKRYQKIVGNTPADRARYAEIYKQNTTILEELEQDPKNTAAVTRRIDAFRVALLSPGKDAEVLAEINTYLLTLGDPRVPLDTTAYNRICSVLMILPERGPLLTTVRGNEPTRKLLRSLLLDRSTPATLVKALQAAQGLELAETRDWALSLAVDAKQAAEVRAWAVLVVGQGGGKQAVPLLEPLLKDATEIGKFNLGKTELKTELRDVVLAALIRASAQKFDAYPFPYFQAIPGIKNLAVPRETWVRRQPKPRGGFEEVARQPAQAQVVI